MRAIRDLERGRVRDPQRESVKALIAGLDLDAAAASALTARRRAAGALGGRPGGAARRPDLGGLCELPSGIVDFTGRAEEASPVCGHWPTGSPTGRRRW